jgi:hypothetical protein
MRTDPEVGAVGSRNADAVVHRAVAQKKKRAMLV